jgi:hypothetical protein
LHNQHRHGKFSQSQGAVSTLLKSISNVLLEEQNKASPHFEDTKPFESTIRLNRILHNQPSSDYFDDNPHKRKLKNKSALDHSFLLGSFHHYRQGSSLSLADEE